MQDDRHMSVVELSGVQYDTVTHIQHVHHHTAQYSAYVQYIPDDMNDLHHHL